MGSFSVVTRCKSLFIVWENGHTHDLKLAGVCSVWRAKTTGVDCGESASKWFNTYLDADVKLVYFHPKRCHRKIEEPDGKKHTRNCRTRSDNAVVSCLLFKHLFIVSYTIYPVVLNWASLFLYYIISWPRKCFLFFLSLSFLMKVAYTLSDLEWIETTI